MPDTIPTWARRGMAATSHPLATNVAVDVLRRGGSAVDAAIAANIVLGVVEPTGCGIGGDLFALLWDPDGARLVGLDASGRSPAGLTRKHLAGLGLDRIPAIGPLPVTVPGCVDGWHCLHERFGRLAWADLFAPAIRIARDGFAVTPVIGAMWARGGTLLHDQPGFADVFLPGAAPPRAGETFTNPALADTLTTLATEGRDAFYAGALGTRIDTFCRRVGCYLRLGDLQAHESTWVEPVSVLLRGKRVWELPPPGQGIAALQMLRLLEPYDLEAMGFGTADLLHHLIEAKKIVYEDRARFYADPAFAPAPVDALLSARYADARRTLLNPHRASTQLAFGDPQLSVGDTICLATGDAEGSMVSLIQSNYRGFGSGLCPDGLGFSLQDRGQLFHLGSEHPNRFEPRKRPFHTIIPGFVTKDGEPEIAFGLMGGDMQPQGHVQVLLNHLVFGMDLQAAGDAPRFHHGGSSSPTGFTMRDGGVVALEPGFAPDVPDELVRRGHRLHEVSGIFGGFQSVRRDTARGGYEGASESRKDGHAAGV